MKIKTAIASLVLAISAMSVNAQEVKNLPVDCFKNANVTQEYLQTNVFKPFLIAESASPDSDLSIGAFIDPSDGEIHFWVFSGQYSCLVAKTMLKGMNTKLLQSKLNL